MIDLRQHYDDMWRNGQREIAAGNIYCDQQIENPDDTRLGLTLLARPEGKVLEEVQRFCTTIQEIEPGQYFYPSSDIHLTILSIISCYAGFKPERIASEKYIETIASVLGNFSRLEIKFEGLTVTNSAVMIQGFPRGSALDNLRDEIRNKFKSTDLVQSIDSRYRLQTAHVTVIRFKRPLQNVSLFLDKLQEYRYHKFGNAVVKHLELVFNDWYQKSSRVQKLKTFELSTI